MMWSKIRKKFMKLVTPDLNKRIDIYCTCYHNAHDDYGEAWITLDGKKIFGGGYYHWYLTSIEPKLFSEFSITHGFHKDFYNTQIEKEEVKKIMDLGNQETSHITKNIGNYINTPFEEVLASNNPIYKAFSLIDRRLGKRRFENIKLEDIEHPLVIILYNLRKQSFEKNNYN